MPAPSLLQLAQKLCIKNIKAITDVGDAPYDRVRCVLLKLESPDQLRQIELASPQICGEDEEIWRDFIKRDIPQWWTKPHEPKNPQNWYKVYRKLRQENQAEIDRDAQTLKATMEGLESEKASHTSKLVDMSVLPDLRKHTRIRTEPSRVTKRSAGSSTLNSGTGSKGKNILEKARKEARAMSLFAGKNQILSTPTHRLNGRATQVNAAPKGFTNDRGRSPANLNNDGRPIPTKTSGSRQLPISAQHNSSIKANVTQEERELGLKALSHQGPAIATTKRNSLGNAVPVATPKETLLSKGTVQESNNVSSATRSTQKPGLSTTNGMKSGMNDSSPTSDHHSDLAPSRAAKVPRLRLSGSPERPVGRPPIRRPKEVDIFLRRPTRKR